MLDLQISKKSIMQKIMIITWKPKFLNSKEKLIYENVRFSENLATDINFKICEE